MAISFKVIDNSQQVLKEFLAAKQVALEAIAITAEAYAQLACPHDTGRLANSLTHATDRDSAYIGTNVEYAPYVEFGHTQEPGRYVPAIGKRLVASYVQPKPFLKPAVLNHTSEYKRIAEQYLKGG